MRRIKRIRWWGGQPIKLRLEEVLDVNEWFISYIENDMRKEETYIIEKFSNEEELPNWTKTSQYLGFTKVFYLFMRKVGAEN